MAEIISEEELLKTFESIGVCRPGIEIMKDKGVFKRILIKAVRNSAANIVKQDMLSIGGDVAVNAGCVNCNVEKSDILVMGTLSQIKKLIIKLKKQVSECLKIAEEMEILLKRD